MNYIGIDIGTTSTKAVLFDESGRVLQQHSIGYQMLHPQPEYSEQNPDEIYEAVINCVSSLSIEDDITLSFSSAMHSFMAVDEAGKPLTNLIIWADNRAKTIANELKISELGKEIYHRTGIPIHPFTFFSKLLWLKENQVEIFNKAYKFIGIKEYIWFKLFGEYKIDLSLASGTGMLNIRYRNWDSIALKTAGITTNKLPKIEETTYLASTNHPQSKTTDYQLWTEDSGLKTANWILGGGDGPLANLGTGAMQAGTMAFTMGTSGAVRICSETPYTDLEMRTFNFVLSEKEHIIGGATNNGAVVIQWLKEQILKTDESTDKLLKSAENVVAGADNLLFLPYLLGERAPVWNADAKGVFWGMNINHTQAHFVRAVMEGIILNLYVVGKVLMEKQPIQQVSASGGFAKSELWLQILADVFQKPVFTNETVEGSAWGAVLIAKRALAKPTKQNDSVGNVYHPNPSNKAIYEQKFEKFVRIYEKLKDEME
jgi:gluconokinase